ncbi:MAG TPA: phosphoribosyltransferase family protein, partial [Candidatus Tripitaka sp. YC43]
MRKDIDKIIVSTEDITKKVGEISQELIADYKEKDVTIVAILNGSLVFLSDLIRQMP